MSIQNNTDALGRRQFSLLAFVFQSIFIALMGIFGRYDYKSTVGNAGMNTSVININKLKQHGHFDYPLFQDIHVMVIVGFGFLMSFLKRYGFSAISVNLLLSAFVIQYVVLLRGFLSHQFISTGIFRISIDELIIADLSCVTVLITMGVLLGKLTPVQFLVLAFIETSFSVILEHILFTVLHIHDGGRSLAVHCFGAYFGLSVSKFCRTRDDSVNSGLDQDVNASTALASTNNSELFSMIGTLFLWIFFPSFNGAAYDWESGLRQRSILNTYFAIVSCTTVTFMISSMSDHFGRFNILHVQSSTLAGGISIGSVAGTVLFPHHAMMIGTVAAFLSVIGHVKITPKLLEKHLNLHDTCGIHNLHGLPGLFAGILSIFFVLYYNPCEYNDINELEKVYPYVQYKYNKLLNEDINCGILDIRHIRFIQAVYQLAGLTITLVLAILGGIFCGWILNFSVLNQVHTKPSYEDTNYYMHAEFSLFGKLENGAVIEEFDSAMRGEHNEHTALQPSIQIKAIY